MASGAESDNFIVKFRKLREERQRIAELASRAEAMKGEAAAAVVERVMADLASRSLKIDEIERLALKAFVQKLKDLREELKRAEREIEELDFRRLIGEVDDVEVPIRRESLSLRQRDLKRELEHDLEEYKTLRAFIDAADERPSLAAAAAAPAEGIEPTVMFESFRLKRPAGVPPASVAGAEAAAPEKEGGLEASPVAGAGSPAPREGREEESDGRRDALLQPSPSVVAEAEQPPPAFPPLHVEDAGVESLIVNHDFASRLKEAAPGSAALEEIDDLSQLDALSKSLERAVPAASGALRPVPVPAPPPSSAASKLLEGEEAAEDATIVRRPSTDSHTMMVAQPMLLLKGQDGSERGTFVLKPGVSTVGRGLDSEVVLDDRAVSRKHATIAFEMDGGFRITDLGSENGTYVNGIRITSQVLKDGDEVHLGKSTLIFSLGR